MASLAIISQILLLLSGVFLIIVVLLQRGRGGGLAGAFGGLGGQSAFGTKAGDVFTRITIAIAIIWVALAGGSGYFLRASSEQKGRRDYGENEQTTETGTSGVTDDEEFPVRTEPPIDESDETDDTGDGPILPEAPDDESDTSPAPEPSGESPTEE